MQPKSKWVAFFLCLFFGVLGAHKFYEGKILFGVIYILTAGFCGIGVVVDLIILLLKPNPYYP
ncbi:MAG: TM2 domain-containing protein [Oscillospiraceae bacterium]|jgi:TM2 domain-containing membrane protein YozV|nr:TM2 domain-containing protein [Oscillospiraceae bacterium]